jgi:hypothetical protein
MPTIDIPDKICAHCSGTRWRVEHKILVSGNKVDVYRCAVRAIERSTKWKLNNPDNVREHNIKSCKNRRDKGYFKTPKERERSRLISKKERDTLVDNYVYRRIFSDPEMKEIDRTDIPKELLEIKRKQLLLIRQIKNNGKDN